MDRLIVLLIPRPVMFCQVCKLELFLNVVESEPCVPGIASFQAQNKHVFV